MSRTDKTRPIFVRMVDHKDVKVGILARHNHVKGYCDLPDRHDAKAIMEHHNVRRADYNDSCHWNFSYKGVNICGCSMCTGKFSRREERRAQRHAAKASLAVHKNLVNNGIIALDEDEVYEKVEELGNPEFKKVPAFW